MRMAYADPPYVGQSRKRYGGTEVNHRLLIAHLCDEFPDGWAVSCSSPSLQRLLPLCPPDVRIGAWVKPFAAFKVGVNPAYAWEPVIFHGGRQHRSRDESTTRDWCSVSITLQRGTAGAKPDPFCFWVFLLLGLQPDDEFVDLFPGSGAVGRAWDSYRRQLTLSVERPTSAPSVWCETCQSWRYTQPCGRDDCPVPVRPESIATTWLIEEA